MTDTIRVGVFPIGIAITPDGTTAYVGDGGSSSVSVIDLGTNTLMGNISVPMGNVVILPTVSSDGSRVYLTDGTVIVTINAVTKRVISTIHLSGVVGGIALAPPPSAW